MPASKLYAVNDDSSRLHYGFWSDGLDSSLIKFMEKNLYSS